MKSRILFFTTTLFLLSSCVMTQKLHDAEASVTIELESKLKHIERKQELEDVQIKSKRTDKEAQIYVTGRYDENGEPLQLLHLEEVLVTATLKNVAEREGEVLLKFNISIPKELQDTYYNLMITPYLFVDKKDAKPVAIEPLVICGNNYSVVRDRQYYFADLYKEKYKSRDLLNAKMDSIINNQFITTIKNSSLLLDTTLTKSEHIVYTYTHKYKVIDDITRVFMTLEGEVVSIDGSNYTFTSTDTLQYSLSSLTTFTDMRPRYIEKIILKHVKVEDQRFIVFDHESSQIVEMLENNKTELGSICTLIDSIFLLDEFIIDSIKIVASSSPEGRYDYNYQLSKHRAESLSKFIKDKVGKDKIGDLIKTDQIGENWTELKRLISQSKIDNRDKILAIIDDYLGNNKNIDNLETYRLRRFKEYTFIREEFYPRLRSLTFTYNLRRKKMVQDTVKTNEIDPAYKKAVELLKKRQYSTAVKIFKYYNCQNYALCLINLNYNLKAFEVLKSLPESEDVNYLLTIVCCRLNRIDEAKEYFKKVLKVNKAIRFRATLDTEMKPLLDIMPELYH